IGTLNFGTVALGSVVTQTFAVQNTGGGTVSGTASVSAPFSVVSGGAFSLVDVGAIQAVTVAFGPTISATVSGNVNVTANGGTISRIVTGIGVGADTTPPAVAITSPTSLPTYSTSSSSLTLAGTASDNVGVTQVAWASSGGGSGTASGTTSWTAGGIALQPGTNVLTVTASDRADERRVGNESGTLTVTSSDTTPPTVAITSPTSSSTYSTSSSPLTLGGTAADNDAVTQVTWANSRGGSGTATGTTSWTASGIPIQLGTNVLTVTASDAAGNTATASVTVSGVDAMPPTIAITSPTSSSTYSTTSSSLTLGGTAADNVGVTQVTWANSRGGSGTATGTTSWTASGIPIQLGTNVLTVAAQDAAGNSATASVTVSGVDAVPPTVAITSPTSASTYSTTSSPLTLGGTVADNVGVTQVTWVNSAGGRGTAT